MWPLVPTDLIVPDYRTIRGDVIMALAPAAAWCFMRIGFNRPNYFLCVCERRPCVQLSTVGLQQVPVLSYNIPDRRVSAKTWMLNDCFVDALVSIRRLFLSALVCLSVINITQTVINGF